MDAVAPEVEGMLLFWWPHLEKPCIPMALLIPRHSLAPWPSGCWTHSSVLINTQIGFMFLHIFCLLLICHLLIWQFQIVVWNAHSEVRDFSGIFFLHGPQAVSQSRGTALRWSSYQNYGKYKKMVFSYALYLPFRFEGKSFRRKFDPTWGHPKCSRWNIAKWNLGPASAQLLLGKDFNRPFLWLRIF